MMIEAIIAAIFDMDGLLVGSEPLWASTETAVFGSVGLRLNSEMCKQAMGMESCSQRLSWRKISSPEQWQETGGQLWKLCLLPRSLGGLSWLRT